MAAPALAPCPGLAERPGSLRRRRNRLTGSPLRASTEPTGTTGPGCQLERGAWPAGEDPDRPDAGFAPRSYVARVTATRAPQADVRAAPRLPPLRRWRACRGVRPGTGPEARHEALRALYSEPVHHLGGQPAAQRRGGSPTSASEAGGTPHLGPHSAAVAPEPPGAALRADHPAPTPGIADAQLSPLGLFDAGLLADVGGRT